MTIIQLNNANSLIEQINILEKRILLIRNQKTEYIDFWHGNGNSRSTVCDDEEIISLVKEVILQNTLKKLEKLNQEFKEL